MANRGYEIYMYDHTIEKLPYENPAFHWFKKGIAGNDKPKENLYSLASLIKANGHENKTGMILKMDVEGAEYEFLETVTPEVLKQFDQLTFEFHMINVPKYFKRILTTFEKLNRTHQLIHAHQNNAGVFVNVKGKKFPDLLELTYVLRDKYNFAYEYDPCYPLDIDTSNVYNADFYLDYWNRPVQI